MSVNPNGPMMVGKPLNAQALGRQIGLHHRLFHAAVDRGQKALQLAEPCATRRRRLGSAQDQPRLFLRPRAMASSSVRFESGQKPRRRSRCPERVNRSAPSDGWKESSEPPATSPPWQGRSALGPFCLSTALEASRFFNSQRRAFACEFFAYRMDALPRRKVPESSVSDSARQAVQSSPASFPVRKGALCF